MPTESAQRVCPSVYLVSACLVGLRTRYDGSVMRDEACRSKLAEVLWIPVCPEQLGGLPTPRIAADIIGGDGADVLAGRARVVRKDGVDVTLEFILGAQQVLAIACAQPIAGAILKARSPSCGLAPLVGVTAALLISNGIAVQEF